MLSTMLRALRGLVSSLQGLDLSPNAALSALGRQYACGRINREEYERVKRDLCDSDRD